MRALVGASVIGMVVLGTAIPANADPFYYGPATCTNSVPGSQALNSKIAKHQIGFTYDATYLEKSIDMGSNTGYSRFRFSSLNAAWATISSTTKTIVSTSWACRSASW